MIFLGFSTLFSDADFFNTFVLVFFGVSASAIIFPSFEKILVILIKVIGCLWPYFFLEFFLLLFLKTKTVLFLVFFRMVASTLAPLIFGLPISVFLSSFKNRTFLNATVSPT